MPEVTWTCACVSEWRVKDFTKQCYKVLGVGNFIVFGWHKPYMSILLSKFSVYDTGVFRYIASL